MPKTFHKLTQKSKQFSSRMAVLSFAALLLASVVGLNLGPAAAPKASANPADYSTYNWTTMFPDDTNEAGIMKVLACKQYRSDPVYGAVYDVSLWVVNTTDHHRSFKWEQWRAEPPNSTFKVRDVGQSDSWYYNMQTPEFSVSAWPYIDSAMVRFIDPVMPQRAASMPVHSGWMVDCL